jgi:pimeloyl-ACP methyl ester carboxylesterase
LYFYGSLREEISGTMKEANQNFSLKDASLVLLHGFMEDSRIWHSFETALKDSFTVFCPNLPGHGFNPTYLENPSMETYAEYLNAKIPDEKPLVLIGHSMGGYVALAFAERYPKRVSGLVLLNSICLADSEARKQERDRSIALMQHNYPLFAKSFVPQIFADSKHPAVDEITEMALQQQPDGMIQSTRAMRNRSNRCSANLGKHFPALLLAGRHDKLISANAVNECMLQCPSLKIEWLENAGHIAFWEEPEQCLQLIRNWIAA